MEFGQSADELGLGRRVRVVAVLGVTGDAGGLLAGVALGGLLGGRVGLQAQRLVGGQHLEQERQPAAPASGQRRPELTVRVGGEHVEQGPLVTVGFDQQRRPAGMRPHPQLGLGVRRRDGLSEQLGDRGARAPGVGTHRVVQQLHSSSLPHTAAWAK
jgi:hypothetical protein